MKQPPFLTSPIAVAIAYLSCPALLQILGKRRLSNFFTAQRKMILDQAETIRDQEKQINELRVKLSIVDWRTFPKSQRSVKL